MAKDASLESMRVAIRKCEAAVASVVGLPKRFAEIERRIALIEQGFNLLRGRGPRVSPLPMPPPAAPAAPLPAELDGFEPPPSPLGAMLGAMGGISIDAQALEGAVDTLKTALGDFTRELAGEVAREISRLTGPSEPAPAAPPKAGNGRAPGPVDLSDIGVDPSNSVVFEQPRG